jgi:hypothetical protein
VAARAPAPGRVAHGAAAVARAAAQRVALGHRRRRAVAERLPAGRRPVAGGRRQARVRQEWSEARARPTGSLADVCMCVRVRRGIQLRGKMRMVVEALVELDEDRREEERLAKEAQAEEARRAEAARAAALEAAAAAGPALDDDMLRTPRSKKSTLMAALAADLGAGAVTPAAGAAAAIAAAAAAAAAGAAGAGALASQAATAATPGGGDPGSGAPQRRTLSLAEFRKRRQPDSTASAATNPSGGAETSGATPLATPASAVQAPPL